MGNLSISRPKCLCSPVKDIVKLWGHVSLGSVILIGNKVLMIKCYYNTDECSVYAD